MNKYERKIKKALSGKKGDFNSWYKECGSDLPAESERPEVKEAAIPKKRIIIIAAAGALIVLLAAVLWIAIGANGENNYSGADDSPANTDPGKANTDITAETIDAMTENEISAFTEEYAFLNKFVISSAEKICTAEKTIYVFNMSLSAENGNYTVTAYFTESGAAIDKEGFSELTLSAAEGNYIVYYSADGGENSDEWNYNGENAPSASGEENNVYYMKTDFGGKTIYIKAETSCSSAPTAISEIFE